jgi:hypothetical protein
MHTCLLIDPIVYLSVCILQATRGEQSTVNDDGHEEKVAAHTSVNNIAPVSSVINSTNTSTSTSSHQGSRLRTEFQWKSDV